MPSTYQFTTIDGPAATYTEAYGISNSGLVSGFYYTPGASHGFLWENGAFQTVDHHPDLHTLLGDVNEPGLVAGNYGSFTVQHATLYSTHTGEWMTLPDVSNLPLNLGNGINPRGQVVGFASMGNLNTVANSISWIWDGGTYSFFIVPGATGVGGTQANGINASGVVTGDFQDMSGTFHGFVKQGSRITTIDVPGALDTFAFNLNNSGELVGYYVDSHGVSHGFLLTDRGFTTIDVPGSLGTFVFGINEKGDLVGLWQDLTTTHGFLASRQ
jgi:uncharacterized membrane protein